MGIVKDLTLGTKNAQVPGLMYFRVAKLKTVFGLSIDFLALEI